MAPNTYRCCRWYRAVILAIMVGHLGCGTWVGNPSTDENPDGQTQAVDLSVKGTGLNLGNAQLPVTKRDGSSHGVIVLESALFAVSDISIAAQGATTAAGVFKGPFLVDAIKGTVYPTPSAVTVPVGTYQDMRLAFHNVVAGEVVLPAEVVIPEAMYGNSVYLKGVWQLADGSSRNLVVALTLDDPILLRNSGSGFVIDSNQHALVVAMRMDHWFAFDRAQTEDGEEALDLGAYEGSGDVVLDSQTTGAGLTIRHHIEELIEHAADHGIDTNGDGILSQDEDEFDDDDDDDDDADGTKSPLR